MENSASVCDVGQSCLCLALRGCQGRPLKEIATVAAETDMYFFNAFLIHLMSNKYILYLPDST